MGKESVEGHVGAGFYVPSEEINRILPERAKGGERGKECPQVPAEV